MNLHEYRTYARDSSLSHEARGVLSVMVLPDFDLTGVNLAQLHAASPSDSVSDLMQLLTELVDAGYATRHEGPADSALRSVWRATDKAFETATERVR